MISTKDKIIDYFSRRGISVTRDQAAYIISVVRDALKENIPMAIVIKYRHTFMGTGDPAGQFEKIQALRVPYEKVLKVLEQDIPSAPRCWMFEIYDPEGNPIDTIYTIRSSLF